MMMMTKLIRLALEKISPCFRAVNLILSLKDPRPRKYHYESDAFQLDLGEIHTSHLKVHCNYASKKMDFYDNNDDVDGNNDDDDDDEGSFRTR